MRKRIVLLLALVLAVSLTACLSAAATLDIGEADRIELRSGDSGAAVQVTDAEDIRHITDNINTLRFEKVKSGNDSSGWSYSLSWYGPDGALADEMVILNESRINYNGDFYMSVGAGIDTVFLDRLLEGAGENQD